MRQHTYDDNDSAEPPSKKQKRNILFGSREKEVHTATYWPRDLIPLVIPNARVLTYGYDTRIRHKLGSRENGHTIYDIAWDFLIALEAERRVESSRPIYFIVHSLGGIIVKEMLRRSSDTYQDQAHLQDIFNSTIGVMFFGTPHNGTDPRGILQRLAETVAKVVGFSADPQVVNGLLPRAERLQELRDFFGPRAQHRNWIIHTFQEELGIAALGGQKATIEIKEHIRRNHMDMCRFTGPDDIEYRKVAFALRRMTGSVSRQPRREEKPRIMEDQKRLLLESLRFEQINARRVTIKKAHIKTCRWLLKKSEYLDWLDSTKLSEHHGFLWIKGKPGTGKSTLMKFVLDTARKMMKNRIIISFFFNARGEGLEKSTLGTYQSLLLQLLERLPVPESLLNSFDLSTKGNDVDHQWSIESLKELFEQAVLSLEDSSVVCLIDALDECNERQIRDMISFFEHVGELAVSARIRFQVCFSSRHYPHITIGKGLDLVLEGQEGHTQDIVNYLESELKIGHSKVAEQIRTDLKEKAAGVFMWVVLVVEILNKEHDSGRVHALRRKLQDIPSDLHELFCDILTRDSHNREELILCIQWVLFARQPLSPEQLYFAILSGVEPQPLSRWDRDEISLHDIQRFILDSSKGLAEITMSETPKVQFIHESVKDFLLHEDGLGRIWFELGSNFQGQSHERLKQCCINYMKTDVFTILELSKDLPKASSQEATILRKSATEAFPFLEYAVRQVLYHADVAQGYDISQKTFISSFQLVDWIRLDNLFERHQVRRHTPSASFLYILAEWNMSNLIQILPSCLSLLEVENERYGLPLFAALATKSESAVQTFLKACAARQSLGGQLHGLCDRFIREGRRKSSIGRDFSFSKRRTVLSCLAESGDEMLFAVVLATERFTPDCKDKDRRTPLSWAASNGHETIVKLLLDTGKVQIDSIDNEGRTPLSWATIYGNETIVKLLLDTGKVEIDPKDSEGRTSLSYATSIEHATIVKLLLDTGKVEIDSKDNEGRTSLSHAASKGHETILKLLLDTGKVQIDSIDNEGRTSLSWATIYGNETIVKLLLDTGKVEIDSKDSEGRTSLSYATSIGHAIIVKLLLDTGKVEIDSKDNEGRTPLSHAASKGHETILKLLLDTGKVQIDSIDNEGRTPLSWATIYGNETIVKLLLDTGKVEIDPKDSEGRTSLSYAASIGHATIVKLLLDTGKVEIDSKDNEDRTSLSHAAFKGHETILKLLLDTGKVDVNSKDNKNRTSLSCAASYGHATIVKLLLDTGKVQIDSIDNEGRTPLSWATIYGYETIVKLLLDTGKVDIHSKDKWGRTPLLWARFNGHEAIFQYL